MRFVFFNSFLPGSKAAVLILLMGLLAGKPALAIEAQSFYPETTSGLKAFYQAIEYDWSELDSGVPPFILERIPEDINTSVSTKEKKKAFFMGLLPMVLLANEEILSDRQEFLDILERHRNGHLSQYDQDKLERIKKRYGLRGRPLTDHRVRSSLLRRIDSIPPSLVLAQAANESAWGTSRFARLGNNIFGEWTYRPGTGIVPKGRPEGATYEVKKFPSLYESVRSYMNNLNRNGAYRRMRQIREELRQAGKPVTGAALAKGLHRYSERGAAYIRDIRAMIEHNRLARVNKTFLRTASKKEEALTTIRTAGAGLFSSRNRIIGHRSSGQNP